MRLRWQMQPAREALAQLSDRVEAALLRHGVSGEQVGRTRLIVEELACNTLEHGHLHRAPRPVEVIVHVQPDALVLEFHDSGPAFDPRSAPVPDLDADVAERPIGGLGLHLVQQLADRLDYHHDGGRNVVRIVLLQPADPALQESPA